MLPELALHPLQPELFGECLRRTVREEKETTSRALLWPLFFPHPLAAGLPQVLYHTRGV